MGSMLSKRSPVSAVAGPRPAPSGSTLLTAGTTTGSSGAPAIQSGSAIGLAVSNSSALLPAGGLIAPSGASAIQVPSAVLMGPAVAVSGPGLPISLPSGPGLPKFDEEWIRLAIVVHEFSCEAVTWVLDDAICKKHPTLAHKGFDDRLEDALRLDKLQLSKTLLNYQVPTVFPSSGFGKYADFDIGLIRSLIRYFVGNRQWLHATSGIPAVENLKTYNWANANPLALVALLSEFRNWIFHNTGGITNFSQMWGDLLNVLNGLNYDTNKVTHFKSGPLDYGSKVVVETVKEALRTVKDLLTEAIRVQADPAWKPEFADLEQRMVDVEREVQKDAEYSKSLLITVQDRLERMQTEIKKLQVFQGTSENTIDDRVQQAKEACWSTHDLLLNARELDLYGDQVEGKCKADLMVSLVTMKCSDADAKRLNPSRELEYHLELNYTRFETVTLDGMFKNDKVVLVRGLPGSGKTTLCHFILREWQAGRLWKDRYDLIFHVNAPFLVSFLDCGPYNVDRVLKELYPGVFSKITFEQLRELKYLVIVDSIDECDIGKICSPGSSSSAERAIEKLIVSPEKYDRIIVGRPHACDEVRASLLQNSPFQFVEVVGFSTDQLMRYVDKFCEQDVETATVLWKKINDNKSLFSMAHLPVFANIACSILSEYNSVQIKTQTELYVWAYAVFLTRHLKKHQTDVDVSTFEQLFQNDRLIEALKKVSEMAYKNLTGGKVFFKQSDIRLSDIELTLVSSFLVRRQKFLCFSHLTLIEFFSSIYLFINRVKFDEKVLRNEHLRGVFHMYFGLLGASATNSDSPEIICMFVQPLIKKFKLRPIDKHPLSGDIGRSVFKMEKYSHDLFVNLSFEFRNPQLLRGRDVYWQNDASLLVSHHHELDAVVYLVDNLVQGKRTVRCLLIRPTDNQLSMSECEKVRDCLKRRAANVNVLGLWWISPTSEQMEVLAEICSLVSRVELYDMRATSELWKIFIQSMKKAKRNRTLRLKEMGILRCNMDEVIRSELEELGIDVSRV